MSLISKPIKEIKSFFDNRFKWLEKKMDNESKELKKVEKSIKNLKKTSIKSVVSKKTNTDFSGWSDKKMMKFWLFALLVGLLGYFVYNTLNIIFLIIWAYIISMIMESLILLLQKIRFKRWFAIVFAYIIFVAFMLWLLVFVVPFLLSQMAELVSIWINYLSGLQEVLSNNSLSDIIMNMDMLPEHMKEYFFNYYGNSELLATIQTTLQDNLSNIVSTGKEYVQVLGWVIVTFVSWFASFVVDFLLFITLAVLFSVEKDSVMSFLANLSWKDNYDLTYMKLEKMYKKLAIWLKARLALSWFVALAMWLALRIMSWFGVEIPNKLWLAILTWLLDIIPYIWPLISGLLLFIIWLLYNTIWVAWLSVWILFGINFVQNNVLTPLFMNRALWVNSVLILISMVIWWMIMWFLWVLLAVPIAVIITLLTQDKEKLEKDDVWSEGMLKNIIHKK